MSHKDPQSEAKMDTSADSKVGRPKRERAEPADAGKEEKESGSPASKRSKVSAAADKAKGPAVSLDDAADRDLLSSLSFSEVAKLKHVDVVCRVSGSEVRLWRCSKVEADPATETFSVTLHEWPSLGSLTVRANRLRKHTAMEPCV